MAIPEQLLLNVRPRADIRLTDFAASAFDGALAACHRLLEAGAPPVYLWGDEASGRSVLLAALAQAAGQRGLAAVGLPLAEVAEQGAGLLAGLEEADLLLVDQLEAIAGQDDWEEGLFHLYNRAHGRSRLLFAAAGPVAGLGIRLPDLRSRLQQAGTWSLPALDDSLRRQVLAAMAQRRGLLLADDAERYLLERGPRALGALMDCLERLDRQSLREQRRLTLPFLRQALGREGGER